MELVESEVNWLIFSIETIFFAVVYWPILSVFAVILGTVFFQKENHATGKRYLSLDRAAYRKKVELAYLSLPLIMVVRIVLNGFTDPGSVDVVSSTIGFAVMFSMGVIANSVARRLRTLGYSPYWALLCTVPLIGHILTIWLAFSDKMKTPHADPDVFN